MKCKICNEEQKLQSMFFHLKWKHNLTTQEYIKKYGEYNPKKIHQQKIKNQSDIECKICGEKLMHNRQLMHHLTKKHSNISQEDYIIKFLYNDNPPLCKCGCGNKTEFLRHGKNNTYFREYIKGHWDWIKPNWISHSQETKDKMRQIKIDFIKENKPYYEGKSEGEKNLINFIKQYINIEENNKSILSGKELDIIIPQKNIAIEYNGMYYHSDLFKDKNYHINKTKECLNKGIRLIHIWEYEWEYKNEIVKSNLLNILGLTPTKIYARKCQIKEVSSKECSNFLEKNHLQGNCVSKVKLGLFYNNELVSIMTFSKLRKNIGAKSIENHWELIRFCNKLNTTVIGGASKLFQYFIKNYKPKYIISYANRDWSNGNLYNQLGMKFIKFTTPGYHYTKSKLKYNRFNFRKDKLIKEGFDPLKTEYEIMSERGYYRIWNTGNLKYELFF